MSLYLYDVTQYESAFCLALYCLNHTHTHEQIDPKQINNKRQSYYTNNLLKYK